MDSPLLSIIVRTMNRPALLEEALRSIAKQSWSLLEVIVVNDGGEDVTTVIEPFYEELYQLRYIALEKNMGRSGAANRGLEHATGKYIALLDDDDWLAPDHYRPLIELLEHPGNRTAIAAYGGVQSVADSEPLQDEKIFNQPFDRELLQLENMIPIHAILFRRSVLSDEPICRFDSAFELFEDWDFLLQLMQHGDFIHHDAITAFYRVAEHSGEGVASNDEKRSILALEQILAKWVPIWGDQFVLNLVGRARFLDRKIQETNQAWTISSKQYEERIKALSEQHEERIKALSEQHEGRIKALSEQHEGRIRDLKEQHEDSIETLNDIHNTTIDQLKSSRSWRVTRPLRRVARIIRGEVAVIDPDQMRAISDQLFNTIWNLSLRLYRSRVLQPLINMIPFAWKQSVRGIIASRRASTGQRLKKAANPEHPPLVSIIIPVYNHADYLVECIESAINQSYPHIEVLIYNDASPEPEVGTILQRYSSHERCQVFYGDENQGISRTQNRLLIESRGDIIAFLDCDDYLESVAVERSIAHWGEKTVYLHTGRINMDERGNEVNRISFQHLPLKDYFKENLEQMFATHFKLIHRDVFAKVGLFDPRFDSAQDYDMLMRIAFHYPSDAFFHLPEFLYHHRLHDSQTTEKMGSAQDKSTITIQHEARLRESARNGSYHDHFISIIMLSYGKKEQTLKAIESLSETVRVPHEIILFDNGSSEQTVAFIQERIEGCFDSVKVIYNTTNLGPAAGRKAALQHLSTEKGWVLFFDNDEIAEAGWIEELLVRASSDQSIGMVCCRVAFPDHTLQFSGGYLKQVDPELVEVSLYNQGDDLFDLATLQFRDCDWCPVGATLFTFNPDRYLHDGYPNVFEDVGISMAIHKDGWRLVNSPASLVWHDHVIYQKKRDEMHSTYMRDRYNPKLMLTSLRSFYRENGLIIQDEYVWRENGLESLSREELIALLEDNKGKSR